MAKQTFTTGQVLTAAQMTSLQQTAMLGGAASAKTASYTLVAADAGTAISMSNASATTITVNTSLFAAGDTVQITNIGAGICTITAGTATVNSAASLALAQYESGTLDFTSTSSAVFLKAAGAPPAAGGGLTLISQYVAAADSAIDFTSISGSYKQLLLTWAGVKHSTTGSQFGLRLNADSGNNYQNQGMYAVNVGFGADSSVKSSIFVGGVDYMPFGAEANSSTLAEAPTGYILIDNYSSSTKAKTYYGQWVHFHGSYTYNTPNFTGYYNSTSAITQVNIFRVAGSATLTNNADTTIRLYGIS
jgi:hypothetical protein